MDRDSIEAPDFGAWLQGQLEHHDLTADEFAERIDVLPRTVQNWLTGRATPGHSRLLRAIAREFNLSWFEVRDQVRPYIKFGKWLRDQLEARNLTQQVFADEINANQGTVSTWINGYSRPTRAHCYAIAERLGVSDRIVLDLVDWPVPRERPTHFAYLTDFPDDKRPAAFLDPIIASGRKLSERDKRRLTELVAAYVADTEQ